MRFYLEHVEDALRRQLLDHTLPGGVVVKNVWPWAWGVLKWLKVSWVDLGEPKNMDLFASEWINFETNKGIYRVRVTKASDNPSNLSFEGMKRECSGP